MLASLFGVQTPYHLFELSHHTPFLTNNDQVQFSDMTSVKCPRRGVFSAAGPSRGAVVSATVAVNA